MKNLDESKRDTLTASIIFAVTVLCRFYFLGLVRHDPGYAMPMIDSLEFDSWAAEILNGKLLWSELKNHTPLYAYFLALVYKIFGYKLWLVSTIQFVLAGMANVLLFLVVRRAVGTATGLLSSAFFCVYWFLIYVNTFIFSENLSVLLNIVLCYVLLFFENRPRKYFAAGGLLGLSALVRPDILPLGVVVVAWLIAQKYPWKRIIGWSLIFWSGLVFVMAPVVLRNYVISNQILLRTQVGANFYMGNSPEFKGSSIDLAIGKRWDEFISRPHQAHKRDVTESESNAYYFKETFKMIGESPGRWLVLMASKAFSLMTGRDFLRSEDVYYLTRFVDQTPFTLMTTRLVCILAVPGLILAFRRARDFGLFYVFIIAEIFIIFFQIKTRYLLGVMPFVMVFAGYTLVFLFEKLRARQLRPAFWLVLAIGLFNVVSYWNPLKITYPDVSEVYYAFARNYSDRGMTAKAEIFYQETLKRDPLNDSALNDHGVMLMNQGDCPRAMDLFKRAMAVDSGAVNPRRNYRICEKALGI